VANLKITVVEQIKKKDRAYREKREEYHINILRRTKQTTVRRKKEGRPSIFKVILNPKYIFKLMMVVFTKDFSMSI